MAYIDLGLDETWNPGITGLLAYRPETARPIEALADALLVAPGSLSRNRWEITWGPRATFDPRGALLSWN